MSGADGEAVRETGPAATFESLGFVRDGGVRWRREAGGRTWTLTFMPQRRTRYYGEVRVRRTLGWRLRIDTSTTVMVRAYMVRRGFARNGLVRRLYRWRRLESVPLDAPADAFVMVTSAAAWTRQLLATADAAAAFNALAEYREAAGAAASVYFDPGSMHYASPLLAPEDVTPARVAGIVEHLSTLAVAAEHLPPPVRPATLNATERLMRDRPYLLAIGFFVVGFAILTIGSLLLMVLAWVVFG